jgi:hypothetical protein
MEKRKIITVAFAAACVIALSLVAVGYTEEALPLGKRALETKSTGSMNSGDALVELKPSIDKNHLIVKFRINTHSVSLNRINMKDMVTLEYRDKVLKPVKASRVGGHHASGKIIFNIEEGIDSFTIRIRGIPKVEDRVYEWS